MDPALQKALADADAGRVEAAIAAVRVLSQRAPRRADALEVLAILLARAGRLQQAMHHFQRAAALEPRSATLRANFGNALLQGGKPAEAAAEFQAALAIAPQDQPAWQGLFFAQAALRDRAAWLATAERILERWPDWRQIALLYVHGLREAQRIDDALVYLDAWNTRHPRDAAMLSGRAHLGNFRVQSRQADFAGHQAYGAALGGSPRPPSVATAGPRPLRVGILSGDLRTHSVGFFLEPLLEHRPADVECLAFSTQRAAASDRMEPRFRALLPAWHDVETLSDPDLDQLLRAQRLDVLLELSGHTGGNRLGALRHKPAPVIVHALGYPNTTGHPAFDARVVDSHTDPPGAESFSSERLLRLDPCFLCYRPLPNAPEPTLPAGEAPIVFGSFNNTAKLSPETIALWSRLLRELPAARLFLKSEALSDPAHASALAAQFAAHGLEPDRLEMRGFTAGLAEHLALYGRVHVALDPFPYQGTTTTCEALWMGLPVVVLEGDRHAARVGVSLLHAVGHPEWIARSEDDYVRLARELASDLVRLRDLRVGLRGEVAASPLVDGPAYAARFFAALRSLLPASPDA